MVFREESRERSGKWIEGMWNENMRGRTKVILS